MGAQFGFSGPENAPLAIELVMDLNSFLEPYGKGETGFEDKIVLPKNGGPGAHCL